MTPRSVVTGICFLLAAVAAIGAQAPRAGQPGTPAAPAFRPAAGAPAGTLRVLVTPPALVYIDGTPVRAEIVEAGTALSVGLHRVRVIHPDYQELVRTLRIDADQVATLTLSLAEKGVRKPPTAASAPARGRGAAVARGATPPRASPASARDPELERGIQFVNEGDFAPAAETLLAVSRNLAGVPRFIGQQALAFLYLGVAYVELEQPEQAKRAFALAQRTDKTVSPKPTEFSPQVLAVWDMARAIPADEEIELTPRQPEVARKEEVPPPAPDPPVTEVAALDPDAEFITESANVFTFDFVVPTGGPPCAGTLTLDRDTQSVEWNPEASGCIPAFAVPFGELRSPAAAPRGGLLLQFRSDRPSLVVMPKPDADMLDPSIGRQTVSDLPASTRVHIRRAQKYLYEALGRPWSSSITNLLIDVPVAELLENPADYDGGIVRTSGKLVAASPTKGPYTLKDENVSLQIVPTGAAVALLRSRANEWVGHDLIVSGTFTRPVISRNTTRGPAAPPAFLITASKVEPAEGARYSGPARQVRVEELVKSPPLGRELVRVIGKYRGANTFGDLPLNSRRTIGDWVIKDQTFAVWITGKSASGNGFELDPLSTRDLTSQWVAITGTVEDRKGFIYVRATKVELSPPPTDTARVVATAPVQSGARNFRPDISFTAPNEGLEELTRDQQIIVQFTKPMDEKSFVSRIQLRYADGTKATFPYLSVTYYADRGNSIMIDPGTALLSGKTLECVLLAGIKDIDNQQLLGTELPGGRVLKWTVGRR